jgi:hypothetical protein
MRRFSNYCEVFNRFEQKICQTKPNSEMPKMNIYRYNINSYSNISGLSLAQKQSQTKPNLSAYVADKFALSVVEGPVANPLWNEFVGASELLVIRK